MQHIYQINLLVRGGETGTGINIKLRVTSNPGFFSSPLPVSHILLIPHSDNLPVLITLSLLLFISSAYGSTGYFQKALLGLSVFALVAQIIFQIVLGALPPYGHFFPNCKL